MTIPRHRTVTKHKVVKREINHSFEFTRADLLRLLRLPDDAVLRMVSSDSNVDMSDASKGALLLAECVETK